MVQFPYDKLASYKKRKLKYKDLNLQGFSHWLKYVLKTPAAIRESTTIGTRGKLFSCKR